MFEHLRRDPLNTTRVCALNTIWFRPEHRPTNYKHTMAVEQLRHATARNTQTKVCVAQVWFRLERRPQHNNKNHNLNYNN